VAVQVASSIVGITTQIEGSLHGGEKEEDFHLRRCDMWSDDVLDREPAVMLTLFLLMPDGEGRDRGDGDPLYTGVPRGTGACSWSSLSCSNPGWREVKALTATEKDKESYLRTPAFILELV
jgi:hypothetical protein